MADYTSSLPIRTEADSDSRVQVKIVDATTVSQQMTVDADSNAHVEIHGNDPAGVDRVLKTSEQGSINVNGVYNAATNSQPSNVGLIAHTRGGSPIDADQSNRLTAVTNGSGVHALDVSLHDELGNTYSSSNPLPVVVLESEGVEVNDYKTTASVAASTSTDHDYVVTALKILQLTQIHGAASGRAKFEVKVETGVGTNVFTSFFVFFNSTANPNIDIILKDPIAVSAGVRVRITITNRDNQAQDVYSTLSGHEA